MMLNSKNETDNETLITSELDDDTAVRPEEGSITAAESSKCVLCGSGSRKSRKRQSCNTYQEVCQPAKVIKTISRLKRKFKNIPEVHIPKLAWIQCTNCDSQSCIPCINAICETMKDNNDHINDEWFHAVTQIITQNKTPPLFIGHCCELRIKINAHQTILANKTKIIPQSPLQYDGYLHLPQLNILIPSPTNKYVDVHGFGGEDNTERPGLLHGVINQACAENCYRNHIIPDGRLSVELLNVIKDIRFENIYGTTTKHKCYIQIFKLNSNMNTTAYKHRDVTPMDIDGSRVLESPPPGHIWIVLAKLEVQSVNCHLVTFRWPTGISSEEWGNKESMTIFNETKKLLANDGLDAARRGGSNGLTTYSNFNIIKLLSTDTAFSRKGKGVKVVKSRTKWNCYYIAAGGHGKSEHMMERKVARWPYPQPQLGGAI